MIGVSGKAGKRESEQAIVNLGFITRFLSGKKTYLVAASAVVAALLAIAEGRLDPYTGFMGIALAISQICQRAAIGKEQAGQ